MKKTLSLVLAAVLALGTTATAFAAHGTVEDNVITPVKFTNAAVYVATDMQISGVPGSPNTNPVNEGIVDTSANMLNNKVSNSKAFYLELDTDADMSAKDILKTKVKAEWAVGKDLVEKVSVVYKKFSANNGTTFAYAYFVEIKAKPGIMMSAADLEGTVKVSKSSFTSVHNNQKFDFGFGTYGEADVKFANADKGAGVSKTETANHTVWDTKTNADSALEPYAKIVSFQKNTLTETTITFNGVAEYEIDVKDQDKLYLAFDRKANADIIAKHPDANMEFVNFPGKPMFYKTGLFYLYANDAETFVYETKEDGTIAAVKTVWDEDYAAHKFAVRQFAGTYIVSDVELQLDAAPVAPVAPETKPNPNTGR